MKLEVGMYVRTDKGYISKINWISSQIWEGVNIVKATIHLDNDITLICPDDKFKASNSIIDLIEVGDYVNGERVIALRKDIPERDIHMNSKDNFIFVDYDLENNWYYGIDTDKIKSVVTKEQFENMVYEVK